MFGLFFFFFFLYQMKSQTIFRYHLSCFNSLPTVGFFWSWKPWPQRRSDLFGAGSEGIRV